MMKKRRVGCIFAALLILASAVGANFSVYASTEDVEDAFITYLQEQFQDPEMEYRPEVRWWMAEGTHTDETLLEEIDNIYESGFGAVEFLAMEVYGSQSGTYGWGSEEWVNDTKLIVEAATEKGLGFSLTSGTNWGTANLPDTYEYNGALITPDHPSAAKQLSYKVTTVTANTVYNGELPQNDWTSLAVNDQELVAIVAVGVIDNDTLDLDDVHVLTTPDDYTETSNGVQITWTAPNNNDAYNIFAFWLHGTGEISEPSVSYNYTINYLDSFGVEALIDYWENVILTDEMLALIAENGRGELYMDSLEVNGISGAGGLHWGYNYLDEFEARRGYSLEAYIPFLLNTTVGRASNGLDYLYNNLEDNGWSPTEELHKVRNDFFQTNTELYIENVLVPLQDWLHQIGMTLRAEISYGGNFYEISQPGKFVDGIETESLEFATQIDSFRNLSGVAHLYGKTLSSEMGAVMSGLTGQPQDGIYSGRFDRLTQIMFTQFATGISRNVFHTYTSQWGPTVETASWPGYVGKQYPQWPERIGPRHPSYQHYNEWNLMISRYQKALRQGIPRMDIGILRSDYLINCNLSSITFEDHDGFRAGKGLYYDISLQDAGYTYDYFSPVILQYEDEYGNPDVVFEDGVVNPNGPGYQALIVYQEELPLESAEILLDWAGSSLPIVIVNNSTELGRAVGYGGGFVYVDHSSAASRTPFNNANVSDADTKLAHVMAQLRQLENVIEIDDAVDTVSALRQLGVYPRVEFEESNNTILTYMRKDEPNDALYIYAYNYQPGHLNMVDDEAVGDPYTMEIAIDDVGKPYSVNAWTGEIKAIGTYRIEGGRTVVELSLEPGAATLIVLNLDNEAANSLHVLQSDAHQTCVNGETVYIKATESGIYTTQLSDGTTTVTTADVPDNILLDTWDVTVETWTEGELNIRYEDKDIYNHSTTEYKYETRKTTVPLGELTELKAWTTLGIDESGIGTYITEFDLPAHWSSANGAILQLGSIYRGSAVVWVNGNRLALPLETLKLDITDYLLPGESNELIVEVSSNLQNSVRGDVLKPLDALQNYGLVGEAKLVTYSLVPLDESSNLKLSTGAYHVKQNEYANITTEFIETVNSNTAILNYTFDTNLFTYADFHLADGVQLISKEATDTGAKVVVMIGNYGTQAYGQLAIQAKPDAPLTNDWITVRVDVEYVGMDESGNKEILAAAAATSFTTRGNGTDEPWDGMEGDTNDDGVVDLIDLSNMIDWFGIDSSSREWNSKYTFFDFNNNGEIDIYDIVYVAQLIK